MRALGWTSSAWSLTVPGGRYEVSYLVHTLEYEAWFWPRNPRESGESVRAPGPDGREFETLGEAQEACEAHNVERGKLRAV